MLLDLCKQTGLRIFNGRMGDGSSIGHCTYVGSSGSSVIDVICLTNLLPYISLFCIDDPNILTDYCLIYFTFQFDKDLPGSQSTTSHYEKVHFKYKWNSYLKDEYLIDLSSDETLFTLKELNEYTSNACTCNPFI